jgi:hypothetical protein
MRAGSLAGRTRHLRRFPTRGARIDSEDVNRDLSHRGGQRIPLRLSLRGADASRMVLSAGISDRRQDPLLPPGESKKTPCFRNAGRRRVRCRSPICQPSLRGSRDSLHPRGTAHQPQYASQRRGRSRAFTEPRAAHLATDDRDGGGIDLSGLAVSLRHSVVAGDCSSQIDATVDHLPCLDAPVADCTRLARSGPRKCTIEGLSDGAWRSIAAGSIPAPFMHLSFDNLRRVGR